ncbi:MAG: aminotransferase class III-fold pyridoxal phosphate-dependent enzyme, partial [Pirellulaceae bacterium]|nr:aminotransferase class III-fold pyridoxal phosphate-dependent enzyme [Pirellulaceae bacterium]
LGEYRASKTFYHGHTYGGNPLAAAVALATLEVFEEEQTLQQIAGKSEHLGNLLDSLKSLPHVGDVRHRGLVAAVELVQDQATHQPFPWEDQRGAQVCRFALEHGVWLRPLGNVIVIMPPLNISAEQLEQIIEAIRKGIVTMATHLPEPISSSGNE